MGGRVDQRGRPRRQAVHLGAAAPQAPQRPEERLHHARVELRPRAPSQLRQALAVGQRAPVRALAGHGVVAVHHAQRARDLGDRVAGQPVRVAAPVAVLVVVADAGHELVVEQRLRDLGADARVLAHELPLLGRQRPGLEQHPVGHADLADVVEEGGVLQLGQPVLRPAQLVPEQGGVPGHPARMAQGVVVLGAQGGAQGAQVGEVQPADLGVQLGVLHGQGDQLGHALGDADLLVGEAALHVVEELDGADHLVAGDERQHDEAVLAVAARVLALALVQARVVEALERDGPALLHGEACGGQLVERERPAGPDVVEAPLGAGGHAHDPVGAVELGRSRSRGCRAPRPGGAPPTAARRRGRATRRARGSSRGAAGTAAPRRRRRGRRAGLRRRRPRLQVVRVEPALPRAGAAADEAPGVGPATYRRRAHAEQFGRFAYAERCDARRCHHRRYRRFRTD